MENKTAVLNAGTGIAKTHSIENKQPVGFLSALPAILRNHGVDPLQVLAAAGLGADSLDHPGHFISSPAVIHLIAVAAETTAYPQLGLEIGRECKSSTLGALGELVKTAATLRVALQDFAAHWHRYAPGCVAYLIEHKEKGMAVLGTAAYQPNLTTTAVLCDGHAMALVTMVRELAGSEQDPALQILLSRTEPTDAQLYRDAFAVDIRFNAEQTAVVLRSGSLDRPMPDADTTQHTSNQARVRAIGDADDGDIVNRLRRSLRVALLKGKISANQISVQLGMSRRTLHRRLEAEGVHYQEILDQTRCGFAQQLLADTTLRIGEIATIVGYTDPSALTRRFIRWTGVPPNEWRSSLKASKSG